MRQAITSVSLDMTTVCDRACPDCCQGINMGLRKPVHHDWVYFERAASVLYGIERVHLTGGEPTTHPKFAEFVPRFRELFGCRLLTLQTDGFGAIKHRETLKHFDWIVGSLYDQRNEPLINTLIAEHNTLVFDGRGTFTPRSRRGSGLSCERGTSEAIAYADGRIWPCVVGPGIPGAISLEPTADWRERLGEAPLPCSDCWFSP